MSSQSLDKQIEEIREKLAEIEHERWSDWQAWCHKILRENCPSPELEAVLERWDRQIATPYKDLSEAEKQSDREQVDRYLPLIQSLISDITTEAVIEELSNIYVDFDDRKLRIIDGTKLLTIDDRISALKSQPLNNQEVKDPDICQYGDCTNKRTKLYYGCPKHNRKQEDKK